MARWVRIGTALYLALALPGLIFGFLLKVDPLPRLCEPEFGLLGVPYLTSGDPCQTVDVTFLYWLLPAVAFVVIGLGVARARMVD
ncbi:hypothetical protein OJ997_18425 [Solirubrobacter phytolaccae]|uniref:Uncharacterized protein n=1 Tax=Solirubrobacter phytolaccae TaxID=1404360 RepID=A0A9X3NC07_9ACTN|nr:hypothetical protein [Solirubrobacter phytolaccae]MDA0182289.1 hypothetical protein [Solirubrobacter phytolaccae]